MTPPPDAPYRLRIAGPAARALSERLPPTVVAAIEEFLVTDLVEDPHRVSTLLRLAPLEGIRSARRGAYRVLCEVDDDQRTVTVLAIGHRADVSRA